MSLDTSKYYFLDWQFEPRQDCLKHLSNGTRHKLEPQVTALLLLLIENKHLILSKEELNQRLWPEAVVDVNSVYQLLTKLRRLLDDSPKQASIIKTFPKKGYQFIAQVRIENNTSDDVSPPNTSKPNYILLASCITLVFILAFTVSRFYLPNKALELNYKSIAITTDIGLEVWPDISPDNQKLIYIRNDHQLWLRVLEATTPLLKNNKQAELLFKSADRLLYPRWSDEGDKIALWQINDNGCFLSILDPTGLQLSRSSYVKCQRVGHIVWKSDNLVNVLYNIILNGIKYL